MPGTDSTTMAESFDVRYRLKSANGDYAADKVVTKESPCCNYTFPHSSTSQTVTVQVRTKHDNKVGEWSPSSMPWATTSTCTGNDYLYRGGFKTPKMICDDEDMKYKAQPVLDPTEWKNLANVMTGGSQDSINKRIKKVGNYAKARIEMVTRRESDEVVVNTITNPMHDEL
eukprot:g3377.t1